MPASDIKDLGDALAGLTVAQASGLAAYLKDAYRIEAPAGVGVVLHRPTTDPKPKDDDQPATVDVVLVSAGDKKINVIKAVRQHTGLGLKEAKDLVEGAPQIIKSGVDRAEADKLRQLFEAEGAKVEFR